MKQPTLSLTISENLVENRGHIEPGICYWERNYTDDIQSEGMALEHDYSRVSKTSQVNVLQQTIQTRNTSKAKQFNLGQIRRLGQAQRARMHIERIP